MSNKELQEEQKTYKYLFKIFTRTKDTVLIYIPYTVMNVMIINLISNLHINFITKVELSLVVTSILFLPIINSIHFSRKHHKIGLSDGKLYLIDNDLLIDIDNYALTWNLFSFYELKPNAKILNSIYDTFDLKSNSNYWSIRLNNQDALSMLKEIKHQNNLSDTKTLQLSSELKTKLHEYKQQYLENQLFETIDKDHISDKELSQLPESIQSRVIVYRKEKDASLKIAKMS